MRLLVAIGAIGLVAAIPLAIAGSRPSMDATSKVLGLAGAVAGLIAVAVALRHSPRPGRELADYKAELRNAVRYQWRAEEVRRRLHDPMPIPVRWRVASSTLGVQDHWANVTLGRDKASIMAATGTIADLAEAFLRLPSGRLVIIGPPGAGKTTLVTRLLLDLISDHGSPGPVPVLLAITSWDPRSQNFHGWLAGRLGIEYAALSADVGDGRNLATALVENGHVIPVLDGLDEMPLALRSLAIHRLNASLHLGEPLVLTCRTAEYVSAVAGADAITAAGVIELLPLTLDDITGYLPRTTRPGPDTTTKWDPVLEQLRARPDEARSREIVKALSPPLMTSLAREAFSDTNADPGVLFTGERFAHAEAIAFHLLDMAVPVAYQAPHPGPGSWEPARSRRWLVTLAGLLDRAGTYDLAWWRLVDWAPPAVAAVAGAAVGGIALLAVTLASGRGAVVVGLLTGLGAVVGGVVSLRHSPVPTTLRWSMDGAAARLRRSVPGLRQLVRLTAPVGWLAWIAGTAFLLVVVGGRAGWFGAAGCAAAVLLVRLLDLWFDVPAEVTAAPSPEALLRADRATALSRGMLRACIVGGTVAAVARPTVGLAVGLSFLLASMAFTAWGRFTVIRCWYALRGRLPWRLVVFLGDAAQRGVLRRMGAVYQFRHARLQDRLAQTDHPGPDPQRTIADPVSGLPVPAATASPSRAGEIAPGSGTFADLYSATSFTPEPESPALAAFIPESAAPAHHEYERVSRRPGSTDDVVVILTALELEYSAVRTHLMDLRPIGHPAGTLFEVGLLAGCKRPIVLSAVGEGNQTAAVVTERATAMFAPRALLFVGIAGALDEDIALGDVVVATRVYAYHGGRDQPGGFRVRPRAWDASHELEQRARYISRLGTWLPSGAGHQPSVHFRPIAAGEVVLAAADSGYASLIERYYSDAAAVEMEGAGVVSAAHLNRSLPVLVIRGISDRANAEKKVTDKAGWQHRAAANAAAFTLSLVASLQ